MKQRFHLECPVCGMKIMAHEHEIVYLQMRFVFCSEQCKERFLAHPRLYVGYPGQPAPKQEGHTVIKRRRIHLAHPLSVEGATLVQELLYGLMGVHEAAASDEMIEVTYDLLQVSLEELERTLTEAGAQLGAHWPDLLRRALIHGSEEVEIEANESTPPHHYLP